MSLDAELLELTREMLDAAKTGEWERLIALEQSRLPLFRDVFAQGVAAKEELARQVLKIDEETQSLAKAVMPDLQKEILQLQNSGKANNAYQSVQGTEPGNR